MNHHERNDHQAGHSSTSSSGSNPPSEQITTEMDSGAESIDVLARMPNLEPESMPPAPKPSDSHGSRHSRRRRHREENREEKQEENRLLSSPLAIPILAGVGLLLVAIAVLPSLLSGDPEVNEPDAVSSWSSETNAPSEEMQPFEGPEIEASNRPELSFPVPSEIQAVQAMDSSEILAGTSRNNQAASPPETIRLQTSSQEASSRTTVGQAYDGNSPWQDPNQRSYDNNMSQPEPVASVPSQYPQTPGSQYPETTPATPSYTFYGTNPSAPISRETPESPQFDMNRSMAIDAAKSAAPATGYPATGTAQALQPPPSGYYVDAYPATASQGFSTYPGPPYSGSSYPSPSVPPPYPSTQPPESVGGAAITPPATNQYTTNPYQTNQANQYATNPYQTNQTNQYATNPYQTNQTQEPYARTYPSSNTDVESYYHAGNWPGVQGTGSIGSRAPTEEPTVRTSYEYPSTPTGPLLY